LELKLIPFREQLVPMEEGVRHAEIEACVSGRVSPADGGGGGRTPVQLSRELTVSAQTISTCVAQAAAACGKPALGKDPLPRYRLLLDTHLGQIVGRKGCPMRRKNETSTEERGRWSSKKKMDAVLRLLKGADLDTLSRELRVNAATLSCWRERCFWRTVWRA
jgi:hypothetical protein